MIRKFALFDMDGVLLNPQGYHQSLQTNVKRIGQSLGAPNTELSSKQIARLEALGITNEWDSLAICSALTFLFLWKFDPHLSLKSLSRDTRILSEERPDFDSFIENFNLQGDLPCQEAAEFIFDSYDHITNKQRTVLEKILLNSRDLTKSPILATYQETVLGSALFEKNYGLRPALNSESYLLLHDQPVIHHERYHAFQSWLRMPAHKAGIMTNRPSRTPKGYQSSPEAELGAKRVALEDLPILGSGLLAWYARTQLNLPDFSLIKPNPVHTLALLQMCLGRPAIESIRIAVALWKENSVQDKWSPFHGSQIIIFEDAAKGLISGERAQALLQANEIPVELKKFGVTRNSKKIQALVPIADAIIPDLNAIDWKTI